MTETVTLDLYGAACLTGGLDRVVDAALAALIETGRVRPRRDGGVAVAAGGGTGVEAAVLDAIGPRTGRAVGLVRLRAVRDARVVAVRDRLVRDGLLPARPRFGHRSTGAGRRALRAVRAAGVPVPPAAWAVALAGPAAYPDVEVRTLLVDPPRARARRRGRVPYRGGNDGAVIGTGMLWGVSCGTGGDASCGGGSSCGGGGGCGGGGCGSA
jgi:hypothetical protein